MVIFFNRTLFTLIELLVVFATISILAALLLPALGTAKARTKYIKCISNLKQLNLGFVMYESDNNTYLPPAYFSSTNICWDDLIMDNVGNPRWTESQKNGSAQLRKNRGETPFNCPLDKWNDKGTFAEYYHRSYGINLGNESGTWPGVSGYSWSAKSNLLKNPSSTILLSDSHTEINILGSILNCEILGNAAGVEGLISKNATHGGAFRWNYLLCDGSAANMNANDAYNNKFWNRQK